METYIEKLRAAVEAVGILAFDRRFTSVATAERLLRLDAELKTQQPDLAAKLTKLMEGYAAALLYEINIDKDKAAPEQLRHKAAELFHEWLSESGVDGIVQYTTKGFWSRSCIKITIFKHVGDLIFFPVTEYSVYNTYFETSDTQLTLLEGYARTLQSVLDFHSDTTIDDGAEELFRARAEVTEEVYGDFKCSLNYIAGALEDISAKLRSTIAEPTKAAVANLSELEKDFRKAARDAHNILARTTVDTSKDKMLHGVFYGFRDFVRKNKKPKNQ